MEEKFKNKLENIIKLHGIEGFSLREDLLSLCEEEEDASETTAETTAETIAETIAETTVETIAETKQKGQYRKTCTSGKYPDGTDGGRYRPALPYSL